MKKLIPLSTLLVIAALALQPAQADAKARQLPAGQAAVRSVPRAEGKAPVRRPVRRSRHAMHRRARTTRVG